MVDPGKPASELNNLRIEHYVKRISAAHCRHLQSVQAPARVRKLAQSTPALQVNIAEQQIMATLAVTSRMVFRRSRHRLVDHSSLSDYTGNRIGADGCDIRKQFVEHDGINAVIPLSDNLFFSTSAPGVILVAQKVEAGHAPTYAGEILLINAANHFVKGRPKNENLAEQVRQMGDLYLNWQAEEDVSTVVKVAEVVRNEYNLNSSRCVASKDVEPPLPLEDAIVLS